MSQAESLYFNLREQITEKVRTDLICGRIAEGETVSEARLAERFGVSRTPVREALLQLVQEGLLEGRPKFGLKVASRPANAIRDVVIPVRRYVESYALRKFFKDINEDDYRRWNEILAKMQAACLAGDSASVVEYDIEFHRSIIRRAGEKYLETIWTPLVGLMRANFIKTHERFDNLIRIYEMHARVVEEFRSGDVERAVQALWPPMISPFDGDHGLSL